MEYNKEKEEIKINKNLNELDKLILKFTKILKKHVKYVVVAGYVSIALGRTRITEDIDLIIEKIEKEKFEKLFEKLKEKGFWCINAEKTDTAYNYLREKEAIRFAEKDKAVPNIEVKFPKRKVDKETLEDTISLNLSGRKINIPSLERHLAFKRYFLKSPKDKEDALHVEELFKDKLSKEKINKIKKNIENEK